MKSPVDFKSVLFFRTALDLPKDGEDATVSQSAPMSPAPSILHVHILHEYSSLVAINEPVLIFYF